MRRHLVFAMMAQSAVVGVLGLVFPPTSFCATEFQRITASDAESNDSFGRSVSLSGNLAVIGAYHAEQSGALDAGSAYVFLRNVGTGMYSQVDILNASDFATNDLFGTSVGISGNTAVVGAPGKKVGDVTNSGAAYIYRDNGSGDWLQIDTLIPTDPAQMNQEYGYSVAISGNTAIVGAWKQTGGGAAYVFRDNGTGDWNQVTKLTANDAAPNALFGSSVALVGTTAIIGAPYSTVGGKALAGAAYIFQDNGGTNWSQVDKLTANELPDDLQFLQFGTSVALSATTAVIGAVGDNPAGLTLSGSAYVFRPVSTTDWQQIDKLTPGDPAAGGEFGYSVGVDGNTAVVGARHNVVGGDPTGAAYFYRDNGVGQWNQISKLNGSSLMTGGQGFGWSAAINGNVSLIGTPLDDVTVSMMNEIDAGAVFGFNVPVPVLVGDYNKNNIVDAADFTVWRDSFGSAGNGLDADGNGDGVVNNADYRLWKRNFGRTMATGAGSLADATPEPVSAVLFLMAAVLAAVSRRRWGRP